MSERLRHLQRQQALLREHLAWIEGEILREPTPTTTAPSALATQAASPTIGAPSVETALPADADALFERYAPAERQNPGDIRRGCLVAFAISLLLVFGSVGAAWFLFYR